MDHMLLWLGAALLLLVVPGPTNTLMAAAGAESGWRRSLPLIAAELSGYALAISILTLVGGAAAGLYPLVGRGLRAACALYIVWIAVNLWRTRPDAGGAPSIGLLRVFTATLLNPKALVFAFAIIPEVPAGSGMRATFLVLLPCGAAIIACGWIAFGAAVRRAAPGGRVVTRLSASVLAGFALLLIGSAIRN